MAILLPCLLPDGDVSGQMILSDIGGSRFLMTLKQLQTFYWVCHLGSFIAAAERLHTTQSTISMRIHDLERSFGVELFDRSMRAIRPTAKGAELLVYVERLMKLTAE